MANTFATLEDLLLRRYVTDFISQMQHQKRPVSFEVGDWIIANSPFSEDIAISHRCKNHQLGSGFTGIVISKTALSYRKCSECGVSLWESQYDRFKQIMNMKEKLQC